MKAACCATAALLRAVSSTTGEPVALQLVAPVLRLEVQQQTFDLGVDDLDRPEEPDIGRLSVLARPKLKSGMPGVARDRAQHLGQPQLTRVAERGRTSAVPSDDDVDADRCPDCAQRIDLDPRVAGLNPPNGVWRDVRTRGNGFEGEAVLRACHADLVPDPLRLSPRPTIATPSVAAT